MPPEVWRRAGFGLYVHWPFCQAKCPYCDFNSHVVAEIDQNRWKSAYLSEIRRVAAETPDRTLSTVFFGGGTPSLMDPDLVAALIEAIRAAWPMANDPEITLEANPTSVEAAKLKEFRNAGVTRVSLGIQALNDADLRRLGRLHTATEARTAFDAARSTFDRVSFDLIYARQHQSLADWQAELREAVSMAVDHVSLYQLTIEDGTAFGDRHRNGGLKGLPNEDLAADLYDATQEICEAAGLSVYEISNHAKPGAESRHNLIYWRSGDYTGIGPGAHGRLTLGGQRYATDTPLEPLRWLRLVETKGSGEGSRTPLSAREALEEYALMGMRLRDGIPVEPFAEYPELVNNINVLKGNDLVEQTHGELRATAKGRVVLNAVLRELFADRQPAPDSLAQISSSSSSEA